ncbi:MAG: TlpA disulfide reductase family protein [Pseudomonadota bacterium]|nr:TlpA disulfide reductase family protein [Pseudomonadota bacterium]
MSFRSVALACMMLVSTWATAGTDPLPKGILRVDTLTAPPLELQDMDGEIRSLRDSAGRWTFVHFWASWCGPCREEMPTIQRMSEALGPELLDILMVNTAETEDQVFMFLSAVAPDLETLMDPDGKVTGVWQPRGLPSTFLVDPEGRIHYQALGGRPWNTPPYIDFLRQLTGKVN